MMSDKYALRSQRVNMVINNRSKWHEKELTQAVEAIQADLRVKWPGIRLEHRKEWKLKDVVARLKAQFPTLEFHHHFDGSSMRPDGGILSMVTKKGVGYPILIAEKKNQGTNDLRASEGKGKQSKGNAIERLGKNVIGLRTAMKGEHIFPFVCFGDGCDFAEDSSILDRVVTIAMFGRLNTDYIHNQGGQGEFDRGSFYFREAVWTKDEMHAIGLRIATSSVHYYLSKYGEESFL